MKLIICNKDLIVGTLLFEDDKMSLEYSEEWKKIGFPLSPHLPLDKIAVGITSRNFIKNLLPEGTSLEELSRSSGISKFNTFALIHKIGEDPTGAFSFLEESCQNKTTHFRKIPMKELQERIQTRRSKGLTIWDGKPRISITGVQQKLPVLYLNGEFGFGEGDLASTHILKFAEPESNLVLNEYLSMKLAKELGIDVANVEMLEIENELVLLVERFDREITKDIVTKRHIIDGCQALNVSPENKYEWPFGHQGEGSKVRSGASLKTLFEFTNYCITPAIAKQKLIEWILINLLLYNSDAHSKNISFYLDEKGVSIAPFYDLVNIGIMDGYAKELAMAIGDTYIFEDLTTADFQDLCDDCNITIRLLKRSLEKIGKDLQKKIEKISNQIPDRLNTKNFVKKYKNSIIKNYNFLTNRVC